MTRDGRRSSLASLHLTPPDVHLDRARRRGLWRVLPSARAGGARESESPRAPRACIDDVWHLRIGWRDHYAVTAESPSEGPRAPRACTDDVWHLRIGWRDHYAVTAESPPEGPRAPRAGAPRGEGQQQFFFPCERPFGTTATAAAATAGAGGGTAFGTAGAAAPAAPAAAAAAVLPLEEPGGGAVTLVVKGASPCVTRHH